MSIDLPGMGGDFAKGASGPASVYDTSPTGLGLSPAYLAGGAVATASAAAGSVASQTHSTLIDVVSSAVETDIVNFTVTGGALDNTGTLRAHIVFDYLNNTGGALNLPTLRGYYGATKLFDSDGANSNASAVRYGGVIQVGMQNLGASNSQWGWLTAVAAGGGVLGAPTVGIGFGLIGTSGSGGLMAAVQSGSAAAVDSTVDQTFRVTVQLTSSSASHEFRARLSALWIE